MQTLEKTHPKLQELKQRLTEIHDVSSAASLLYWDQTTYMPPGGAAARGRQLGTLRQIAHAKLTAPDMGKLLDDLQDYAQSLPPDSDEASLIRIAQRQYERAVKVPSDFMAKMSKNRAECYGAWAKARPANDFGLVLPYLEKTLELSREYANFFPGYEHIADPFIDGSDYGMTVAQLRPLFAQLRDRLVPIVEAISQQPQVDDSCVKQHFPEAEQIAFSLKAIEKMGYDFQRGRQDKTLHPFMTNFSIGDVRITTRVREDNLTEALFSTIHETGHALYEQGINPDYEATPLAGGTSYGVHESQSRLWENLVGRSRACWTYFYPQLQAAFPQQLGNVPLETFYRAINKVQRSLIRTDADEVTYNLHVIIRFELELELLEGKLAVKDLPEAWNDRYQASLGLTPPNDTNGVLQDVHWYTATIGGMFQCYTLGNIMSAQFWQAAIQAHPEIPANLEKGEFQTLHQWLIQNIYRHGSKYTPNQLLEKVTGQPLTIKPFLTYIQQKYGEIYSLSL